jgi:antitoxin component YwqK of YwqJK toxin-antitoxin module
MGNINQVDELGRRQGLWINYYDDGKIQSKINWLDGNIHGEFIIYHNNGYIVIKTDSFNNIKMNYQINFFENGLLDLDMFFHWLF